MNSNDNQPSESSPMGRLSAETWKLITAEFPTVDLANPAALDLEQAARVLAGLALVEGSLAAFISGKIGEKNGVEFYNGAREQAFETGFGLGDAIMERGARPT